MSVTSQRETKGCKFSIHYPASAALLVPRTGLVRRGEAREGCLPAWSGVWAPWWCCGLEQRRMSKWDQPERDGEGILWGSVCVCVCVCAHTHARAHVLTPMHGCQELCSLSDSAVSSAWLFPCTESNSTRSREKQINLECLVARERKTGGKRRRWREWIWGSSNWR